MGCYALGRKGGLFQREFHLHPKQWGQKGTWKWGPGRSEVVGFGTSFEGSRWGSELDCRWSKENRGSKGAPSFGVQPPWQCSWLSQGREGLGGTRVCFSLLSGLGSDSNPSRSTNPCEGRCGSAVLCLSTQERQKLIKEMQKLGGKQIRIF